MRRTPITKANFKAVGDVTIMSLGWILMVFLLGGALVYGLCWVGVKVQGYDNIGLFSTALLSLIAVGIVRTLLEKHRKFKGTA